MRENVGDWKLGLGVERGVERTGILMVWYGVWGGC